LLAKLDSDLIRGVKEPVDTLRCVILLECNITEGHDDVPILERIWHIQDVLDQQRRYGHRILFIILSILHASDQSRLHEEIERDAIFLSRNTFEIFYFFLFIRELFFEQQELQRMVSAILFSFLNALKL